MYEITGPSRRASQVNRAFSPSVERDTKGKSVEKVELLYSSDCPSYPATLELLRAVLAEERLSLDVHTVQIDSVEEARRQRFPGSPTIRLDGRDIEGAMVPTVGLTCRTYLSPDGTISPVPGKQAIREAVRASVAASKRPV